MNHAFSLAYLNKVYIKQFYLMLLTLNTIIIIRIALLKENEKTEAPQDRLSLSDAQEKRVTKGKSTIIANRAYEISSKSAKIKATSPGIPKKPVTVAVKILIGKL